MERPAGVIHGHAQRANKPASRTYSVWARMIQRCTNPKADKYRYYGGRGIKVCRRWRRFEMFLADMGRAPKGRLLERRNNNSGYRPGNCYWATREEQARNKRNSKLTTKTAAEVREQALSGLFTVTSIARRYSISRKMVREIREGRQWR